MSVVTPARSTSYVGNSLSPPLSDFNSTGSDDGYHEKFVNLKLLVKEQQKQIESKHVQCEALKTIKESLAEERRENSELIENNKKLQCMVALLHDRLVENGLSTRTEFDAIDALVPPSRQLLDHLTEENKKLQKKLEYLKVDPAKMEQLYKVGFFISCGQCRFFQICSNTRWMSDDKLSECQRRVEIVKGLFEGTHLSISKQAIHSWFLV